MSTRIAFLFPGQGSQHVGMGRDLAAEFPVVADTFAEADEALGMPLSAICFDGPENQLRRTENTQPAILTMSTAVCRLLGQHGIAATCAAGHSLGEWSAYVAAGTLTFADALRAVQTRGRAMQSAVEEGMGSMAAVIGLSADSVAQLCSRVEIETGACVEVANLNAPTQTVISGNRAAVELASLDAKGRGARAVIPLHVSAPFHCRLMLPAQEAVAEILESTPMLDPRFPIASNLDGQLVTSADHARRSLIEQVTAPVQWIKCVNALRATDADIYIEAGPGKVLSGLLKQFDTALKTIQIDNLQSFNSALAGLRGE